MTERQRQALLLSLIKHLQRLGSWCGETHIQKSTFFAQEMLDIPLDFNFILYKHGPYSFDLSDEITAMRADLLLTVQSRGQYGPSILPREQSDAFLDLFPVTLKKYESRLEFVADKLAKCNVAELERLATALFVLLTVSSDHGPEGLAPVLNSIKPHVSPENAREALKTVHQMSEEARRRFGG
jgi:uncharacterized protein YwgA